MKNKKSMIILCAVIGLLVVAGIVTWSALPQPLSYRIGSVEAVGSSLTVLEDAEDSVTVQKTAAGDFKILMFTDMHLDGKNKTSITTVTNLVNNIRAEQPDLVLLGGDNVTSGLNRVRAKQLGKIFEKLGVYWAGTLGNHEGDNPYSIDRTEMMDVFSSFEHCLMRRGRADVPGDCNYALHIQDAAGKTLQTVYFFDTFDELSDETKTQVGWQEGDGKYDGVHAAQVQWYTETLQADKARFGAHDSIIMLHIPLPQYTVAAETEPFLYGGQLENICSSGFDGGLFDAVLSGGSTKAVFCGHDHLNNFGVNYKGVLLSYIEPSGYGSYTTASRLGYEEKDWLQGYTRLIVHADGSFENTQVTNSGLRNGG